MEKDEEKFVIKKLSAKELRELDDDPNKPSFLVFFVLEALEWCFWGAVIFVLLSFFGRFLKPVWYPAWRALQQLFG